MSYHINRAKEQRIARYQDVKRLVGEPRFGETLWFAYTPEQELESVPQEQTMAKLSVENADVLQVAQSLVSTYKDESVVILNLASQFRPGGGVAKGSLAQEESLFLRTELCAFLDPQEYKLFDKVGYSFNVGVLALDLESRLKSSKPLFKVDVITAAALKDPKCAKQWTEFASAKDKEFTEELVIRILTVAAIEKCEHLVLGALGCGAYHNPVEAVIQCFQKAIFEKNLGKRFKTITFAIMERGADKQKLGPLGTAFYKGLVGK